MDFCFVFKLLSPFSTCLNPFSLVSSPSFLHEFLRSIEFLDFHYFPNSKIGLKYLICFH